jgi:hypothetical protein
MSDARIGRVLVASLHQAIGEVLPFRLEFYENWLHSEGLRAGSLGLASLSAVLSFLRREEDAYGRVTARAGELVADWSFATLSTSRRGVARALPVGLRQRLALRYAQGMVRAVYSGSRLVPQLRRGSGAVEIRGSIFCGVREACSVPLCGFYAAALGRFLALFDLPAEAEAVRCRASGAGRCIVALTFGRRHPMEQAEAA